MNKGMACALCLVSWLMAVTAVAEPKDKSLAAWEKAQETAEAKAEKELEKEFAKSFQRIEELKTSKYEVGDEIEVTIVKGRVRKVKGTFGGIQKKGDIRYVLIDNTPYLLTDIDSRDRPLLIFAADPEEREEFVKQEERRLASDMQRVREMKLNQAYVKMGYDSDFFKNSLLIGDRFYTEEDLGIRQMLIRLEIPMGKSKLPYAVLRIANPINRNAATELPTVCTIGLRNSEKDFMVFGNTCTDEKEAQDKAWVEYSCFIAKSDLGRQDPIKRVADGLRLNFASLDGLKATWQVSARRLRSGVRTKNGTQFWIVDYRANLVEDSLGEADRLGLLRIQNAILRARSYQRDAAFVMKKKGVVLHGAKVRRENTNEDADAEAAAPDEKADAGKKNP